ncbi:hypothetical protein [Alkalimonas amylolytica]|uniref:Uncharacterized protein n=1 Tax=Alkalimonas amylolytica TaxID=152573 RepID=A0A1H3ZPE6_ALKAM|nr:hypothetical protein [Alkalimonas amylolytica]SEA25518.1 hypothetical protein SAMN04488051_102287 [Alkalimonas amylolytica]
MEKSHQQAFSYSAAAIVMATNYMIFQRAGYPLNIGIDLLLLCLPLCYWSAVHFVLGNQFSCRLVVLSIGTLMLLGWLSLFLLNTLSGSLILVGPVVLFGYVLLLVGLMCSYHFVDFYLVNKS